MKKAYFLKTSICGLLVALLFVVACKKLDNSIIGAENLKKTLDESLPVQTLAVPYNFKNARLANGTRFDSTSVFTVLQLEEVSGNYGSNKDYQGVTKQLPFYFYAPLKTLDTLDKRPFIMLIHGGGFLNGSYTDLQAVARSFAARGYAAATIEYRQGFNIGSIPCVTTDSLQVLKAVYRATQDANAAMRYFVANANTLGIDVTQLYVMGSSAGAVTTASMLYCPQSFFNAKLSNLEATMGTLNNATNTLTNTFTIKAELTTTGYGFFRKSHITSTNCKPSFYMQGSEDDTLPLEYGEAFQCPTGKFGHTYGSNPAKRLIKLNRYPYEQYIDQGASHSVSAHYPSTFYVKKMSSFVKRLWKGDYRYKEFSTFTPTLNQVIQ
jgi:hypothetical protein